jgi:hypothetical protein
LCHEVDLARRTAAPFSVLLFDLACDFFHGAIFPLCW